MAEGITVKNMRRRRPLCVVLIVSFLRLFAISAVVIIHSKNTRRSETRDAWNVVQSTSDVLISRGWTQTIRIDPCTDNDPSGFIELSAPDEPSVEELPQVLQDVGWTVNAVDADGLSATADQERALANKNKSDPLELAVIETC